MAVLVSPRETEVVGEAVAVRVEVLDPLGNRVRAPVSVKACAVVAVGACTAQVAIPPSPLPFVIGDRILLLTFCWQEEVVPITGGSVTTLNGVANFSHVLFRAAQLQVRLRFSTQVTDVDPETGAAVGGGAKREVSCETAPFDVTGASGTGDHLMCDAEAPAPGMLAEAPNRRFRVVYGMEAGMVQLQTSFDTMVCARSGEAGSACHANETVNYRENGPALPSPGRIFRARKILPCPVLEDGRWYTFTTGHGKLLYCMEGDEGAIVRADGPPLPWDNAMSAAAHFKVRPRTFRRFLCCVVSDPPSLV